MARVAKVTLIHAPRSRRRHVKASAIQNHDWYHDLYAATLCGSWIQVAGASRQIPIGQLEETGDQLCQVCLRKVRRFT